MGRTYQVYVVVTPPTLTVAQPHSDIDAPSSSSTLIKQDEDPLVEPITEFLHQAVAQPRSEHVEVQLREPITPHSSSLPQPHSDINAESSSSTQKRPRPQAEDIDEAVPKMSKKVFGPEDDISVLANATIHKIECFERQLYTEMVVLEKKAAEIVNDCMKLLIRLPISASCLSSKHIFFQQKTARDR